MPFDLNEKYIGAVISGLLYIAILVSIPFRRRSALKTAGNLVMKLSSASYRMFGIYILCAAIIAALPSRQFAPYILVILYATAVIGTEIGARETRSWKIAGLYENAILWGMYLIRYEDIYALPTISYEDDPETVGVDFNSLQVILNNNKEVQLVFADREQRRQAVDFILGKRPDLKK